MSVPPILNVYRHDGIRATDVDVTAVTFCDCGALNALSHTAGVRDADR
ncbi:hypothetical protein AB0L99_24390 [Streptomyces sp. NPDC051954]